MTVDGACRSLPQPFVGRAAALSLLSGGSCAPSLALLARSGSYGGREGRRKGGGKEEGEEEEEKGGEEEEEEEGCYDALGLGGLGAAVAPLCPVQTSLIDMRNMAGERGDR